jgi:hypothetical protein
LKILKNFEWKLHEKGMKKQKQRGDARDKNKDREEYFFPKQGIFFP